MQFWEYIYFQINLLSLFWEEQFSNKINILRKLTSSDNGLEATPVPIPNTKVKL